MHNETELLIKLSLSKLRLILQLRTWIHLPLFWKVPPFYEKSKRNMKYWERQRASQVKKKTLRRIKNVSFFTHRLYCKHNQFFSCEYAVNSTHLKMSNKTVQIEDIMPCPPSMNPPWRGEEAYLTNRFQPVHQQEELVGAILLCSIRTNRSSYKYFVNDWIQYWSL